MSEVPRRIFPEACRRSAVAQVGSSGVAPWKVASTLGLHETVLRPWMREFAISPGTAATAQQRAQPVSVSVAVSASENSRLRRENDRLRMEREILKKPSPSSVRQRNEVSIYAGELHDMAGARDVCRAGGLGRRLL
jgi:transposase